MSDFIKEKLHIRCEDYLVREKGFIPRRYTLTHSDSTGDLFLTVACDYDYKQISGLYTRFMRDEVLAEWQNNENMHELHIYVHVSGGFVFGWASMRYRIFNHHMPTVIKAIRNGDEKLFDLYPELNQSPIYIHYLSNRKKYNTVERFGTFNEYL